MAIIRVIHHQHYDGQVDNEFLNVYHYYVGDPVLDEDCPEILDAFETEVLPSIQAAQTNILRTTYLEAIELFGTRFATKDVDTDGSLAGANTFPKFVAISFKLQRTNNTTRAGRKRIAGIREDDFTIQGNPVDATAQTRIDNIKAAMNEPLNLVTAVLPAVPHIYSRSSTEGDIISQPISGVVYEGLTTQNTRKK